MAIIAIAIWPEFVEMWETQDFFGIPGVFTAPWWPSETGDPPQRLPLCAALHLHVVKGPEIVDHDIGLGARFGATRR